MGATARVTTKLVACLVFVFAAIACGGDATPPATQPPVQQPPPSVAGSDAILARCPTADEVAAADRDLTITFDTDPTAGSIVCSAAQSSRDLTLLQAQAYRVLTIARGLSFDAPLPWTAKSLYSWLVSAIHGIRFRGDTDFSFCCDPADTIDIQTKNLAALQFPTDFRWVGTLLVLLVHEARHNEGFPHTCGANDNTIAEMGAWAVQYYLNIFLGSHSDPSYVSASERAAFMSDAQMTCAFRFCNDHC